MDEKSNLEDNFPELVAALQPFVGFGAFFERHHDVNYGSDAAAGEQFEGRKKLSFAAHKRAKNRDLLDE